MNCLRGSNEKELSLKDLKAKVHELRLKCGLNLSKDEDKAKEDFDAKFVE